MRLVDNRTTQDVHILELFVVCSAAGRVDQPARDARNEQRVVDLELHDRVQLLLALLEHAVEFLSLRYCPGEAIKNKASIGISGRSIMQKDASSAE